MTDPYTIIASIAAAAAAGFAGLQIWLSKRDANRRATLDALLLIDNRLQSIWRDDTKAAQAELLQCYRSGGVMSATAMRYLAFLNSLDLLAFSIENGLVDRKLATKHVNTLLKTHVVSLPFLTEFQRCCKDAAVYENLMQFFRMQIAKKRLPPEGERV